MGFVLFVSGEARCNVPQGTRHVWPARWPCHVPAGVAEARLRLLLTLLEAVALYGYFQAGCLLAVRVDGCVWRPCVHWPVVIQCLRSLGLKFSTQPTRNKKLLTDRTTA